MSKIEVPMEHVHETIHEHAHIANEKWVLGVALTSAILAAIAAVAALIAEHHSNEAMIDQIQAADQWGFYQAKGIKSGIVDSRIQFLEAVGKSPDPKDQEKIDRYQKEQDEIKEVATEKELSSRNHLHRHVVFARSVTLFQLAITVAAISILTKRRRFWFVSIIFGAVGLVFMIQGLFF